MTRLNFGNNKVGLACVSIQVEVVQALVKFARLRRFQRVMIDIVISTISNHSNREVADFTINNDRVPVKVPEVDFPDESKLFSLFPLIMVYLRLAKLRLRSRFLFLCWYKIELDHLLWYRIFFGLFKDLLHKCHCTLGSLESETERKVENLKLSGLRRKFDAVFVDEEIVRQACHLNWLLRSEPCFFVFLSLVNQSPWIMSIPLASVHIHDLRAIDWL